MFSIEKKEELGHDDKKREHVFREEGAGGSKGKVEAYHRCFGDVNK